PYGDEHGGGYQGVEVLDLDQIRFEGQEGFLYLPLGLGVVDPGKKGPCPFKGAALQLDRTPSVPGHLMALSFQQGGQGLGGMLLPGRPGVIVVDEQNFQRPGFCSLMINFSFPPWGGISATWWTRRPTWFWMRAWRRSRATATIFSLPMCLGFNTMFRSMELSLCCMIWNCFILSGIVSKMVVRNSPAITVPSGRTILSETLPLTRS